MADEGDNDSNGDDSSFASDVTEGQEPDCDKANELRFSEICKRLELVWSAKRNRSRRIPQDKILKTILPPQMMKMMEGQSIHPYLRLLVPDIDTGRSRTGMKEGNIVTAYCECLGFSKGTKNYEALKGFTDPQKAPPELAGDLSLVVEFILRQRIPDRPSNITVKDINQLLDELVRLNPMTGRSHSHEWRSSDGSQATGQKDKVSINKLRSKWLQKVMNHQLSPLEHKWLVRLLLGKMEFGAGWKRILEWYSPYAMELWNSHNSLKALCDRLADPEYHARCEAARKLQAQIAEGQTFPWQPQVQPATLGNTISPMLSTRVNFANCLSMLQQNHEKYLKKADKDLGNRLSLKFPAICCEIKLDGERFVVHVNDSIVTMHTRRGKWYSELYSPVLGPPLRRALGGLEVNVILDGEVLAYDSFRNEPIPFGSNRTVAHGRRSYLRRHNLLDQRDLNLHQGIDDAAIMREAHDWEGAKGTREIIDDDDEKHEIGKDVCLTFVAFDILYMDGLDARKVLEKCGLKAESGGSLIHLTLAQRKLVLYSLIHEQPNEVEVCKALVVRPNGDIVDGAHYFSSVDPPIENGERCLLLDSTHANIRGEITNIEDIDIKRRKKRSNREIAQLRANGIEDFYRRTVEELRMEGIVLKDLASPYVFGDASRNRKAWFKFKPDYEKGSATDIDVVIVGAFFATGLRHSGKPTSFLCACRDSTDPHCFLTCFNVSGGSTDYGTLDRLLEHTSFEAGASSDEPKLGKWFRMENHGTDLPDFISHRSLQRTHEGDYDGWQFVRTKNYPDLWIEPEDSVVLTVYGQELIPTKDYSSGIALRFARIQRVRMEADEKPSEDVWTEKDLWGLFLENEQSRNLRQHAVGTADEIRASAEEQDAINRFLTPEEYKRRHKKRKRRVITSTSKVPKIEKVESNALVGVSVTVLEGRYRLDPEGLDAREAREQGWYDLVEKISSPNDVMAFVKLHSGTIRVAATGGESLTVGGNKDDAKVLNHVRAIDQAKQRSIGFKHKVKLTKTELKIKELAAEVGVVKWTFLFSAVSKFLRSRKTEAPGDDNQEASIRETRPELLIPKQHDYLLRSTCSESSTNPIELNQIHSATVFDLQRLLEDVSARMGASRFSSPAPWQFCGLKLMSFSQRWVLKGSNQKLWPPSHALELENGPMLYPDVFANGFGVFEANIAFEEIRNNTKSQRWNQVLSGSDRVLSALHLAKTMGAVVSPHLHAETSIVLTDLIQGVEIQKVTDSVSKTFFVDEERGSNLLTYLHDFFAKNTKQTIYLVSPSWIRNLWDGES